MNKIAVFAPAVILGLSMVASAQNEDVNPLYERGDRSWYEGRRWSRSFEDRNGPIYYRPTQRYYGSGYTVSYRYIPVYRSSVGPGGVANGSSNFRTEAFALQPEDVPAWKAASPRLTVNDPKLAAPRAAITTIVRKKSTSRTTAPAIVPSSTETTAPAKP